MVEEDPWDQFFKEVAKDQFEPIHYKHHPPYRVLVAYLRNKLPPGTRSPDEILEGLEKGQLEEWRETELRAHLMTCTRCSRRIKILERILSLLSLVSPVSIINYLFDLKEKPVWRPAFYAHLGVYLIACTIGLLAIFNAGLFWEMPDFNQTVVHEKPTIYHAPPLHKPKGIKISFPKTIPADGRNVYGKIRFESTYPITGVNAEVITPRSLTIEEDLTFGTDLGEGESPIEVSISIDKPEEEVILSVQLIYLVDEKQYETDPPIEVKFVAVSPPGISWPFLVGPLCFWGLLLLFHSRHIRKQSKD